MELISLNQVIRVNFCRDGEGIASAEVHEYSNPVKFTCNTFLRSNTTSQGSNGIKYESEGEKSSI